MNIMGVGPQHSCRREPRARTCHRRPPQEYLNPDPDMGLTCQVVRNSFGCVLLLSPPWLYQARGVSGLQRRWITLISVGWLPPDFTSSRSCLCLQS